MKMDQIRRKVTHRITDRKTPVCVSFPKSGRTWLRKMLFDLDLRVPFTHAGASNFEKGGVNDCAVPADHLDKSVLFLLRDPRVVLVSYHKDRSERHKVFSGSLMEMARTPGIGIDGICQFNLAWTHAAGRFRNFHLLRYEDMHGDTAGELAAVCRFFGVFWHSQARISQVVEASSFSRMQQAERTGAYADHYPKFWFEGADPGRPAKVRRGKAGGFADEMSADVLDYCNSRLTAMNYPVSYLARPAALPEQRFSRSA